MITKLCIFDIIDNTGGFFAKFIGIPGFVKKKNYWYRWFNNWFNNGMYQSKQKKKFKSWKRIYL